jgi:uncharacterized protein
VPALRARVTDLAGLLPPEARSRLETELARFERETSHQIAVLTVPSLEGEPIEDFSMRVAEAWKLGQKGVDNGILVTVSKADRRARIEVGYGLEGIVPDAVANRILEDVMIPRFRSGDYPGGIEAGVDALMRTARGEVVPELQRQAHRPRRGQDPMALLFLAALLGMFAGMPFRSAGRRGAPIGALAGGGVAAVVMHVLLATWGWTGAALLLGGLAGWSGPAGGIPGRGIGPWGGFGGFGGRGFGGGGFGGGGGFSGGGGGFGGGGASGSW